jgi:hypothetical protein
LLFAEEMMGTILAIVMAIWFVALLITIWDPPWLSVDTLVFLEGLAVTMPFIIVFGGIAVAVIGGMVATVI